MTREKSIFDPNAMPKFGGLEIIKLKDNKMTKLQALKLQEQIELECRRAGAWSHTKFDNVPDLKHISMTITMEINEQETDNKKHTVLREGSGTNTC